jgi:hypothetical protein
MTITTADIERLRRATETIRLGQHQFWKYPDTTEDLARAVPSLLDHLDLLTKERDEAVKDAEETDDELAHALHCVEVLSKRSAAAEARIGVLEDALHVIAEGLRGSRAPHRFGQAVRIARTALNGDKGNE